MAEQTEVRAFQRIGEALEESQIFVWEELTREMEIRRS